MEIFIPQPTFSPVYRLHNDSSPPRSMPVITARNIGAPRGSAATRALAGVLAEEEVSMVRCNLAVTSHPIPPSCRARKRLRPHPPFSVYLILDIEHPRLGIVTIESYVQGHRRPSQEHGLINPPLREEVARI